MRAAETRVSLYRRTGGWRVILSKKGGTGFGRLLSQFWFAARVGAWLCFLPVVARTRTLPLLLERIATAGEGSTCGNPQELSETVQIVVHVCRMRLFDLPVFPGTCLRQALALYYVLARMGYPVEIHFGVRKDGRDLHGHSWVTLDGKSLEERTPGEAFRTIYSHLSVPYRFTLPEVGEQQPT